MIWKILTQVEYRAGDLRPDLKASYTNDLTGETVNLLVRRPDDTVIIKTGTITATSASLSLVTFTWASGDLLAGVNYAEINITTGANPETSKRFELIVETRVSDL